MVTPDPIAAAAAKVREWTDKRDALIRQARSDGASLRELAAVTGLSHGTIDNICRRAISAPPG